MPASQNIYDRPDFFEAYGGLRRSKEGLAGAAEWPSLRSMLPSLAGARVLDLGCGFGWFAAFAADAGAAKVLAMDVSERMLDRARAINSRPAVAYQRADLESVELLPSSFDLAFSSLAFHYVEGLQRLMVEVARSLGPEGRLVASMEHPIYTAPTRGGWIETPHGERAWGLDSYFIEGPRQTDWLAKGVVKHHRSLTSLLAIVSEAGLTIERLEEYRPSAAELAERPDLSGELDRPMFLMIRARKGRRSGEPHEI